MNTPLIYHRFINFEYLDTVQTTKDSQMQLLCSLQYYCGTPEKRTYTVIPDVTNERPWNGHCGFSQDYQKLPNNKCCHSAMWRHDEDEGYPPLTELWEKVKNVKQSELAGVRS